MIDIYKFEPFIETILLCPPRLFPSELFNTPTNELEDQFQVFFSHFDHFDFISEEIIDNVIDLFVQMWNLIYTKQIHISTEPLFSSFFCSSLLFTIDEIIKIHPKGDRQLKSYLWALSTVIKLDPFFFDDSIIQILFRIISEFSSFKITLFHCLVCINSLCSIDKFDDFFFSSLDDFLFFSKKFEYPQAIKMTNEFLLTLSTKSTIQELHLNKISKFIIYFATNPIQNYDLNSTVDFINSFISISPIHLKIISENGFFDCFPQICESNQSYSNCLIELIAKITSSPFSFQFLAQPFILSKIIDVFSLKICDSIESQKVDAIQLLEQLVLNLSRDQEIFPTFLDAFKPSIIIAKLCSYLNYHSYHLKLDIRNFFLKLIQLKDELIIANIIENQGIDKIIENDDFDDPKVMISMLQTCFDSLTSEQHKEYIAHKIEEVKEIINES